MRIERKAMGPYPGLLITTRRIRVRYVRRHCRSGFRRDGIGAYTLGCWFGWASVMWVLP